MVFKPKKSKYQPKRQPKATREKPLVVGKPLREQKRKRAEEIKEQVTGQREQFYKEAIARDVARDTAGSRLAQVTREAGFGLTPQQEWKAKLSKTPYTTTPTTQAGLGVSRAGPITTPEETNKIMSWLKKELGGRLELGTKAYNYIQAILDFGPDDLSERAMLPPEDPRSLQAGTVPLLPTGAGGLGQVGKIRQGAKALEKGAKLTKYTKSGKFSKYNPFGKEGWFTLWKDKQALKIETPKGLPSMSYRRIQINSKTQGLMGGMLGKYFSPQATTMILGGLGGTGGAIWWGAWSQAEAQDVAKFTVRDALIHARATGNWEPYDEAVIIRDEVYDLSTWEKIILWGTPASPFVGIPNKLETGIKTSAIIDKIAQDEKLRQESGESEADVYRQNMEDKHAMELEEIDAYDTTRRNYDIWKADQDMLKLKAEETYRSSAKTTRDRDARDREIKARNEDAEFWRQQKELSYKREKEEREAIAEFWKTYWRELNKIKEETGYSSLKFGLL